MTRNMAGQPMNRMTNRKNGTTPSQAHTDGTWARRRGAARRRHLQGGVADRRSVGSIVAMAARVYGASVDVDADDAVPAGS